MRFLLRLAAIACAVPIAVQAEPAARHHASSLRLRPTAGTPRLARGGFRHPHRAVVHRYGPRWPAPEPQVMTGGLWPSVRSPAYAQPADAPRLTPGQQFAETRRWASGGTGLSGMIGNTGNPFAGVATWGTADSATTGAGTLAPAWQQPFARGHGEPIAYPPTVQYPAYGSGPQLGFYSSGAPYSMAYYSSGSSAGPYGSPGGLATYRSGSYGVGPRIIMIPHRRHLGQRGSGGSHIVHVGRVHPDRRHHASD